MTYAPACIEPPAPVHLNSWHPLAIGQARYGSVPASALASAAWASAGRMHFTPFYVPRIYNFERFFWANGSTVGTDSIECGVYDAQTLNLICASGHVLSAGTASRCQYSTVKVQAHQIIASTSTTDGTSFTTASVTLYARPGYMYALVFVNSKASAAQVASAVTTTGGALSFTSRNSQTFGASTEGRVNIWTCVPTSDVTDTIKIDFGGGNTQTGCAWALIAFSNVDTATNHGVVQTAVGSGNSVTPLATLGAFGSSENGTFGVQGNLISAQTPGAGFREMADVTYSTPTTFMGCEFASANDTTVDATITSGQWGAIAAEIKSLGPRWALPAGQYYMALWNSGTTATFMRLNSQPLGYSAGSTYTQAAGATGIPIVAVLAGNVAQHSFLHGITSRASP